MQNGSVLYNAKIVHYKEWRSPHFKVGLPQL